MLRLSLRQIRISTGFVLFTYVTTHFLNHALANISVAAAESGLLIQKVIWQTLPGAVILYASLTTHMGLGFWPLYERRNFRFTWAEATKEAARRKSLPGRACSCLRLAVASAALLKPLFRASRAACAGGCGGA